MRRFEKAKDWKELGRGGYDEFSRLDKYELEKLLRRKTLFLIFDFSTFIQELQLLCPEKQD